MLTRPLPPFRDRPIHDLTPRPGPQVLAAVGALDALLKPQSIKAERKPMKGLPVATVTPKRLPIRALPRLA